MNLPSTRPLPFGKALQVINGLEMAVFEQEKGLFGLENGFLGQNRGLGGLDIPICATDIAMSEAYLPMSVTDLARSETDLPICVADLAMSGTHLPMSVTDIAMSGTHLPMSVTDIAMSETDFGMSKGQFPPSTPERLPLKRRFARARLLSETTEPLTETRKYEQWHRNRSRGTARMPKANRLPGTLAA